MFLRLATPGLPSRSLDAFHHLFGTPPPDYRYPLSRELLRRPYNHYFREDMEEAHTWQMVYTLEAELAAAVESALCGEVMALLLMLMLLW